MALHYKPHGDARREFQCYPASGPPLGDQGIHGIKGLAPHLRVQPRIIRIIMDSCDFAALRTLDF